MAAAEGICKASVLDRKIDPVQPEGGATVPHESALHLQPASPILAEEDKGSPAAAPGLGAASAIEFQQEEQEVALRQSGWCLPPYPPRASPPASRACASAP